ncbi:Urb2/Npa2 family-domain-containing protein [Aspergillus karnatakaensis]|uniref:ribosome biogenesis protein URB2 n=1 Tax=Aspergillus karnatakaensis TaxID=1810916 RepID=UPI003CCCF98E
MPSLPERPRPSQEALLQLEKGTASPNVQLNDAAQIIGLDLSLCSTHPEINRAPHIPIHAAPKEEWVLRWLLKKLKAGKNYRVEPASFLLLRQLIDLIPPKTLASTLKDQKFLGIVDHAITDLTEDVLTGIAEGTNELLASDSESSHTLSESSRANEAGRKGTKRKRTNGDDQNAMDIDEQPRTPASCFLTFTRLLDCLYSLVTLENRTNTLSEAAGSHLRHALRGEPQQIATTLGNFFTLASIAILHFQSGRKTTELQHLFYVLPALLEVWEWRSHRQDDSDQGSSNESFAAQCSQRALRLLHCVRATQLDTDERAHVLNGVERLIALHVVLPARTGFFSRGGSGIDYTASEPDWSSVKPISDTFRPILCASEPASATDEPLKKVSWNTADLIPEFFDIAARSVPRDTFRRQTDEGPWLETLFVAVAELAYSLVKSEGAAAYLPNFVKILEQLFRVALKQKVQLSLHTLLTHAVYTGLLKDDHLSVEWGLLSLLIELGVDIFLPNSGLADSEKYLEALLSKVNMHWRQSELPTHGSYKIIKTGIVLPLIRGFTAARDLSTFMEIWYQQLADIEEARLKNSNLSLFTVWEDDDVCDAYGELMRNPLNLNLASAQLRAAAVEIRGSSDQFAVSGGAYAQLVITESGLRKRTIDLTDDNPGLESFMATVASTLSSGQAVHWRWRLWKLSRNLIENNVQRIDSGLAPSITKLTGVATKSIKRQHKEAVQKASARLECIEAHQLILAVLRRSPCTDNGDDMSSLMAEILKLTKKISTTDAVDSMKSAWNGRLDSFDSPAVLCLAYFLSLVRSPELWNHIKSEQRRSLFTHILSLAAAQYRSSSSTLENLSSGARFLQAWASVVSHEYLLAAPGIVTDLIAVVSERIKEDAIDRKLYIESLQRVPAPLISRYQRGALLDSLQDVLPHKNDSPNIAVGILSLMAKLVDMPKSTAQLTSNWEPIYAIAKAVSLQGADVDLEIMKSYRFLHRAVVAKLLQLAEGDRRKMFKKMYRKVSSNVSKLQFIDHDSMQSFFLRISLFQLWLHREQLGDFVDVADLAVSREKLFGLVVSDLRSARDQCKKKPLEETVTLIKTLDALEDFEDLAINHAEIRKFLSKIEGYVEKTVDSESSLRRLIRRRVLATQDSDESLTNPVVQYAESLPLQHMYSEEQQLFIRATSERFRGMSSNALVRVTRDVRELGFVGKNAEYHLLIAGLAVAAAPSTEDKDSSQANELSLVCTAITEGLCQSKSLQEFVLATECLDVLLRSHPRSISQWNIDSILSSVAVCASSAGPRISPEFSGTIYIRLCRLVGLLLGLHRQKLGGRFHLILPAMQRLLHCLFARGKKRSRLSKAGTEHKNQPHWLLRLNAEHATHFTRLLTSLCDPTVSAVSRPTPGGVSHEGLTDQTKKAKRIAGQYLQYLIQDYAQSSLRGALYPEVKAALLPGLYSVLDVMSRDTMRALNAGLDISGRALFKTLYDDYMKFGRWNKG